ncbi:MAG: RidA family protein [Deltaproteobacteria bacterium]|nr:RidA family protein [Deltaproteobacteria bacterium]
MAADSKKNVSTNGAPKAIGPYSQGVVANGFLFVSGQVALIPETGELISGGIKDETRRVLANIKAIVEAAGLKMDDVVKTTVYLTDLKKFVDMNEVYAEFFKEPYPARATVEVSALPKGVSVEIDAIAAKR